MALKLPDGQTPKSPDTYKNSDLVTYGEARNAGAKAYIASVITPSVVGNYTFVLGDGTNTTNPSTARRRRSTASHYYNGPLESSTSYRISQRVFIGKVSFQFSHSIRTHTRIEGCFLVLFYSKKVLKVDLLLPATFAPYNRIRTQPI